MTAVRINMSKTSFPAEVDMFVSDGVDFILELSVKMDGELLFMSSGWTAELTVKKGVSYQDIDFSCDQSDYITLLDPIFGDDDEDFLPAQSSIGDPLNRAHHSDLTDNGVNMTVKIPSSVTENFSFDSGVFVIDISDGTDSYRVCKGDVNMKKFTSLNSYSA